MGDLNSAWYAQRYAGFLSALLAVLLLMLLDSKAMQVFSLLLTVAWHAIIVILPMLACLSCAVRFGVRDAVLLFLLAIIGGGLLAYLDFWLWLLQPLLGRVFAGLSLGCAGVVVLRQLPRVPSEVSGYLRIFANVVLLWFCYSVFLLSLGLAPTGLSKPLEAVTVRFSHTLPIDNQLPYIFAQQITAGAVQSPMLDDWLSSDRPPLQTAYFLLSGTRGLPNAALHYQVLSTLLQNLWLIGLWLLLVVLKPGRQSVFLGLLMPMLSGVAWVHGLFTWPKLLPVVYLSSIIAVFLQTEKGYLHNGRIGVCVGLLAALAMLCHGGSLFALLGMGLAFLLLKRIPSWSFIGYAAFAGGGLLLTWSLYQGLIDPPGNRLLKWHLAGVTAVDTRTVWQALYDSYSVFTLQQIALLKWANIVSLFEQLPAWLPLLFKASFATLSVAEAGYLREHQFFQLFATLGFLGLLLPVSIPVALKRQQKAGVWLLLCAACVVLCQAMLLVGAGAMVLHHGSLLVVCLAFAGASLVLAASSPQWAWAVAVLHVLVTARLYVWNSPATWVDNDTLSLWLIALVSLGYTVGLAWKITGVRFTP